MKVLLSNPATREPIDANYERYFIKAGSRWPWSTIKKKNEKNCNVFFPFFLAYTASILRERGHDVHVIDGVAVDMPEKVFLRKVEKMRPEVIVIETTTHAINHDLNLARKIKQFIPSVKVVFTGPHVTVFAKEILEDNSVVDFITLGEYEFTVSDLVDRLESKTLDYKIDGLAYRNKNEIWVSDKKGFIKNINLLPYPAFDLFPYNEQPDLSIYRDGICTYKPAVTLHSSRGCPFRCDFCLWNQVMYGNREYRIFSPSRVVDEMEYVIKKFGAKEIYFDDDDFCANKKHVLEICNEIKRRKLKIKWSCMGDAMSTDEEVIQAMASAGCIFMKFGVESGNEKILKNIGKPLKPEKAVETAKLCRKYKIRTHATFCFGLNGESFKTMYDTLRLANRIKFDYAQVSIATPFPGTRYYENLVATGKLKKIDWSNFDGTRTCVFDTESLTSDDIEQFRRYAIKSMIIHKMMDPIWIARNIERGLILIKNQGPTPIIVIAKALNYILTKKRVKNE